MKQNLGLVALVVVLGARAQASAWPPFLPPPDSFPPAVVAGVERVWGEPTLRRSVEGERVPVPQPAYLAFVDAPEVTAAAARHLKLANYEVRRLADGAYEADDHDGARGVYQVLVRQGGRRVVYSRGSHTGIFLGTIRGSALTVMDFEAEPGATRPRLAAWVLIDNRVAASLARVLIAVFGYLADAKLTEGFKVTGRVAEWAVGHPDEFCAWLEGSSVAPARREPVLTALGRCRATAASLTPPRR
jgi:hypothetical protein